MAMPEDVAVLQALRAHVIKGRTLKVDGEDLVFVDVNDQELQRQPKHTATAYHAKSSKKPYDLLAVWTCYKYASLTFSDYVTKCRAEKAAMVSTVDKKELMAYLKGDIETSAQIHAEGEAPEAEDAEPATKSGDKRAAEDEKDGGAEAAKKRRVEAEHRREKENKPAKTTTSSASTEDKEADLELKKVLDKEYTHRNRTTVLLAAKKNFENVLKSVEASNAETKEKIEKASKEKIVAPVAARKEQQPLSKLVQDKIHGTPIIVVPAGFSDLLTMLNVKDFLCDGVYVSNMQKKSEGQRKSTSITIQHEENGEKYTFNIVDSVARFRDKDWRCVVAVIVSGQQWQFKGWKWKFPVETFKRVCGVHVYTQGSQLSDEIKQWDVKLLMIHPDKRHLDKVASREFWRYLFEFLKHKLQ
ncbi:hypothetical protein Poli38472_013802 [Pythium oligandrum]|uniref:Parafibromin n=1 Tax=Pythium oligandrum TaxID=41045 RepID=A0A8K1C249_PYTOL|nr:hypothetical protein Poli38472_013802 [Pythium oligandrum]|eukprot:TMW55040.1 hypothetical protein Poli38472_013802 [Pythium oligandrum]